MIASIAAGRDPYAMAAPVRVLDRPCGARFPRNVASMITYRPNRAAASEDLALAALLCLSGRTLDAEAVDDLCRVRDSWRRYRRRIPLRRSASSPACASAASSGK